MKKLLGLLLIALPAWSHAQSRDVLAFYTNLQGEWESTSLTDSYQVTYSVNSAGLHVQGQECKDGIYGACGFIEQDYGLKGDRMTRNYPAYGEREVEVRKITPTNLVRRELNPIDAHSYIVVIETMTDINSLEVKRQVWRTARTAEELQQKMPDQMVNEEILTLRRVGEPTGITSANSDAGGLIQ